MRDEKRIAPKEQAWPMDCHNGIETVIAAFRVALPNWWYSLGECQVSCDASCAPTSESDDIDLIEHDDRFNSGFHADLPQPSKLVFALTHVMHSALEAKASLAGDLAQAAAHREIVELIEQAHSM